MGKCRQPEAEVFLSFSNLPLRFRILFQLFPSGSSHGFVVVAMGRPEADAIPPPGARRPPRQWRHGLLVLTLFLVTRNTSDQVISGWHGTRGETIEPSALRGQIFMWYRYRTVLYPTSHTVHNGYGCTGTCALEQ